MILNDYFDPVSLEKPDYNLISEDHEFSRSVIINTPDTPIKELNRLDVAIIGIPDGKNAYIQGVAGAADKIRQKLYQLAYIDKKIQVADFGNLKITENQNDTYFAIRDVFLELKENNVILLLIGGEQNLTWGLAEAFKNYKGFWNLTTLDARLDFHFPGETMNARNYLDTIFNEFSSPKFEYTNIGHQVYFTPINILDKLENKGFQSIRLGKARSSMEDTEPVLRDTDIFSVDIGAVRQSDAPASNIPTPNGFFGYELCQLSRYAGASPRMKAAGFFELNSQKDTDHYTAHLIAQAIWYFIDGLANRQIEDPQRNSAKKYIVKISGNDDIIFYNSTTSNRWWMELPVTDPATGKKILISCTHEDYTLACNNEIPHRWWKRMKRY